MLSKWKVIYLTKCTFSRKFSHCGKTVFYVDCSGCPQVVWFLRYRASAVQQKGFITAVLLLASTLAPFLRKKCPFSMLSESFRVLYLSQNPSSCTQASPQPFMEHLTSSFSHLEKCLPLWGFPCLQKGKSGFFFKAFFLSQKSLNLCPVLDIFESLVWTIQLKSWVCES